MASREHQGLQIALIIFVMLTIVLSVTTFIFFSSYDEEQIRSRGLLVAKNDAEGKARTIQDEANELKTFLGAAATAELKDIKAQKDKDMTTWGGSFPDNEKHYRKLVEYLATQNRDVNGRIIDRDAREIELQTKIKADEATKTTEIATYTAGMDKNAEDLKGERDKFNTDREKMKTDTGAVAKQLADKQKELDDLAKKTGDEIGRLGGEITKLLKTNDKLATTLAAGEEAVTHADGRITWVNQKTRTVWLDQGTADGLIRQTSFSVIAADENNPAKAPKKAKVEVTRIQGPHLAEARIVDDDIRNPIMPGDQVMSPVYQPGRSQRFALAGFMDIDGDGESDRDNIRNLIALNGGVVDAEVADDGTLKGELTSNTRFLVMGDRPTDKTSETVLGGIAKMIETAKTYGVRTMSIQELINQMGYKSPDRNVQLGKYARPEDFAPRFPDGVQPRAPSPLNNDNFRPRRPSDASQESEPAKKSAY